MYKHNNNAGLVYLKDDLLIENRYPIQSVTFKEGELLVVFKEYDSESAPNQKLHISLDNSYTIVETHNVDNKTNKANIEDIAFDYTNFKEEVPKLLVDGKLININMISYKKNELEMVIVDGKDLGREFGQAIILNEIEQNTINGVSYDLHKYVVWVNKED